MGEGFTAVGGGEFGFGVKKDDRFQLRSKGVYMRGVQMTNGRKLPAESRREWIANRVEEPGGDNQTLRV